MSILEHEYEQQQQQQQQFQQVGNRHPLFCESLQITKKRRVVLSTELSSESHDLEFCRLQRDANKYMMSRGRRGASSNVLEFQAN